MQLPFSVFERALIGLRGDIPPTKHDDGRFAFDVVPKHRQTRQATPLAPTIQWSYSASGHMTSLKLPFVEVISAGRD